MRCGTIRRTLCANKRPNCSRHVAQKAQCARPRCAKAPSLRTVWPRRVPALGQRCTRAGERSAPGGQRDAEIWITRTAELVLHHLILKCPKTHEGAQLGLGRDMRHQARLAPAENRNQTNQMPHTNIKQSKSHEYHFPIPLVFRIKTIKIPGKSR